jgi:diaminopimelate epimerase
MQGAGNDYVYVNCVYLQEEKLEELAYLLENIGEVSIKISDRHKGIGSDGLVLIMKPTDENADLKMRIFNADGSEAMMCGNATRCVGKFAYENGLVKKSEIKLETNSGIKLLQLAVINEKVDSVRVDMGKAVLKPADIPVISDSETFIDQPIEVLGKIFYVTCVGIGNPHCVVFVKDLDDIDIEKIGPFFENHKFFPNRINTEFIQFVNETELNMRVWERGSGETFACGTGASAAVVAAVLNKQCKQDTEITVHLLGGDLKVTYQSDETVIKSGPAKFVFDTEITIDEVLNFY